MLIGPLSSKDHELSFEKMFLLYTFCSHCSIILSSRLSKFCIRVRIGVLSRNRQRTGVPFWKIPVLKDGLQGPEPGIAGDIDRSTIYAL